ncbi:OmpA family protein [Spongiimicrobium sp. 3-5]|uniref:OmpA family protein n=1 Tax=Spongiimicrobium sp. 3-5 TaxID=3332596 RepID=UPI003980138F
MNNIIRTTLIIAMQFAVIGSAMAQNAKMNRADKKYDRLAFIYAADVYEDVAKSGFKSEELFKKLGNTHYFNANYDAAAKWYGELFAFNPSIKEAVYYLRYAQSLKAVGKADESKKWFNTYIQKAGLPDGAYKSSKDYLDIIAENSGRYVMKTMDINTEGIDFGSAFVGDKVVFASTKDTGSVVKRRSSWDGLSFLDLYEARMNEDGSLDRATKLKGDVNTKFHESSAVFTRDGNTVYFTRNNTSPRNKRGKDEIQHLKIYRAHLIAGRWTDVEDLSINGDNYSTAHPALGTRENELYFVSDRPGSLGQTDIFKVPISSSGSLGKVVNLGAGINTRGRESFPYITEENELYFSSDGHYGLGGYDVFYTQLGGDGSLINVGKPINSDADDVAFVIKNKKGYVSSNRQGGLGRDDIYSFVETKDIKDLLKGKLNGIVIDKNTKVPLGNALVIVLDEDNKELARVNTNSKGYYSTVADINRAYVLKVTKQGYGGEDAYSAKGLKDREHNFELTKEITEVRPGDDIANLLNIVIYFDLDKSYIRPDAKVELEKLVAAMDRNKGLKVDVRSHTDSRANDSYNLSLSDRRARATLEYLTSRGISRNRLTARGYGESQLVNRCSNGVSCTETQHQQNRRSEFIIKQ